MAKPAKRRGRKATGPRFLRDATKDPKIAGLPQADCLGVQTCERLDKRPLGVGKVFGHRDL